MLKHRCLHYKPEKASQIINACVVLHNMCIDNNEPDLVNDEHVDFDFGDISTTDNVGGSSTNIDLLAGRALQRQIVNNYFRR